MNEEYLPRLPLEGAPPDTQSEGMNISFRRQQMGRVIAAIFDVNGMLYDQVRGEDMRDAYDKVREIYPQAAWNGLLSSDIHTDEEDSFGPRE